MSRAVNLLSAVIECQAVRRPLRIAARGWKGNGLSDPDESADGSEKTLSCLKAAQDSGSWSD